MNAEHILKLQFKFILIVNPGLGDHQAGSNQHCYLPGSHNEPPAAYGIPAEEETERAEERTEFEN